MLTRGKLMVQLANKKDQKILEQFDIPKYESTRGVDLNTIDISRLKDIPVADSMTASKLLEHVSPFKRTNNLIEGAPSLNKEPSPENQCNKNDSAGRNQTERVRDRKSPIEKGDSSSDSLEDPFADSGSSYAPSTLSTTSSGFETQRKNIRNSDNPVIAPNCSEHENRSPYVSSATISVISGTTDDMDYDTENCKDGNLTPTIGIASAITFNARSRCEKDDLINDHDASPEIVTIGCSKRMKGNRLRDKRHSCYFCQQILSNNMARHMEIKHSDETEVAKILAMPKKSKRRRDAFGNLIRYGDFYHNCEVLVMKRGELILTRRPNENETIFLSYSDYGPCPECLGFLLKKHIWHHLKYKCASKTEKQLNGGEENLSGKGPIAESTAMLNGILGSNLTPEYLKIVNQFRDDDISRRCKEDDTIMRYGAFMFEKYSSTQAELIRQSMRQLGRLTLQMKNQGEIFNNLSEMLVPEKFDSIVIATKEICKTTREDCTKRPEFGIPSLALKIGYAIKKCAAIQRGLCLRRGDLQNNKKHISFLQLLNLEWSVRISSNALATMYSRKKTAEDLLPLTTDLVKLNKFLDTRIAEIKNNACQKNYTTFGSLILARIIMFNKRRSGEAARMTITQYASRPNWNDTGTQEMKESLTSLEKQLASTLSVVKIVGKRGRIVPIILTPDMRESIEILISKRVQNGILCENPYIFGIANTPASHMRGHDCLKKWCNEADLVSPNLVTSTNLRKYVATVCQVFNLSENEYDWLARHLGHDVRVHREFYRLQENAVELTKVSRLLIAVDQGQAHKFAGKELKDINIQDLDGKVDDEEQSVQPEYDEEEIFGNTGEEELIDCPLVKEGNTSKAECNVKVAPKIKKERTCVKKPWSTEEKEIILRKFKIFIKNGTLPGKKPCTELMKEHEIFTGRKWTDLKYFIKNYQSKFKKTS